jgi:hypothetical protein
MRGFLGIRGAWGLIIPEHVQIATLTALAKVGTLA